MFMDESKKHECSINSGVKLRYGRDVLRLVESPDFRVHFEKNASIAPSELNQTHAARETDLGADLVVGLSGGLNYC
jgi:hypothetical protein